MDFFLGVQLHFTIDRKNKIEKIEKKACILREAVVFYMSRPGETP